MYKNISITHSLLLLPLLASSSLLSSETANSQKPAFNPLEQSLYVPAPTEQSSALVRGVRNSLWDTEVNIHHALYIKTFNSKDVGDTQDLNTAVQNLIAKKQPEKLCNLLAIGRQNYPMQIKISDEQAIAAHNLLSKNKKEKLELLQQKVEAQDKLFIDMNDINKDIAELKKSMSAQIIVIKSKLTPNQEQLTVHSEKRKTLIAQDSEQIRALKTGLVDLHYTSNLKGKAKHFQDGYCSDTEQDENGVKVTYSDDNITQKIDNSFAKERGTTKHTRHILKLSRRLTMLEEELAELEKIAGEITTEKQPIATEEKK